MMSSIDISIDQPKTLVEFRQSLLKTEQCVSFGLDTLRSSVDQ